jgi:DNA-binding LacI/PurR family transcriptional regulator
MLGQGKVTMETRRKVWAAADLLGYVPNVNASELAAGGSSAVGLLLRDAANPAYGLLFTELQKAAHQAGLTLVTLTISNDDQGREQVSSLHRLMGMRVAGLIVATGGVSSAQLEPFRRRLPIIRAGRPETTPDIHAISYDENDAGWQLANYVADRGHSDVAVLVTDELVSYPEHVRGTAMCSALAERGVRVHRFAVAQPLDGVDDAIDAALRHQVTAIMCPTDARQLHVLRAAAGAALNVPRDISVSGCDGILPGADLLGLTTLRIPVEQVAKRTIAHMASLVDNDPTPNVVQEQIRGDLIPGMTVRDPIAYGH